MQEPWAIESNLAQSSLVGAMLLCPNITGEVITIVKADDFGAGTVREIFSAMRDMHLAGDMLDPVTVLHRLKGRQEENSRYVAELMQLTPTHTNWREYANIVKLQSRQHKLQSIGVALAESQDEETAAALLTKANDMMVSRSDTTAVNMQQALIRFIAGYDSPKDYLSWGFDFMDEGLYVSAGKFIVLGGRPSDGKTAFALQVGYHQAKKQRIGFFSFETDTDDLTERIISRVAKVSGKRINKRSLTDDDFDAINAAQKDMSSRHLDLIPAAGYSVQDIQSEALAKRYDVVYIDYLQLIQSLNPKASETEQVTQISKDLHTFTQRHHVTVIALSQLSRFEKQQRDRTPRMSDLRSSGQIEQDADVIMFIYRDDPDDIRSPRNLYIAKNKKGTTGRFSLKFDGDIQNFREDYTALPPPEPKRYEPPKPECEQMGFKDIPQEDLDGYECPF